MVGSKDVRQRPAQTLDALRHCDTTIQQEGADLVTVAVRSLTRRARARCRP